VSTEGSGSTFVVHVPHWNPVHVWITTEDGGDAHPSQVDVWAEPRVVDEILVGRATFEVPRDLTPGYHTLHALDPVSEVTARRPLIVTPRRLSTAARLTGRKR
ncbi:4-alpha-glucanotransferase, partial [Streptomyces sp. SID10244]|nr:4-alpha-glucanotransferase [Streptomyces sp. SID10244]